MGNQKFLRVAISFVSVLWLTDSVTAAVASDFDGDGKSDRVVVRKNAGSGRFGPLIWYILRSSNGQIEYRQFGYGEDRIVAADYDGDGKTDLAVWRSDQSDVCDVPVPGGVSCKAHFYILRSSDGGVVTAQFGMTAKIGVPGGLQHFVDDPSVVADYDGDGKADLAVYREGRTTGEQSFLWYRPSSNPNGGFVAVPWGIRGDEPCPPGDYDGDQKADPCVRRGYGKNPATFFVLKSGGGITYNNYGFGSDQMVNADYDGDFKTDFAVIRAQEMVSAAPPIDWYFQTSGGQYYGATFGLGGEFGDRPTVGDYDGDGRSDIAVWRPPTGIFYAQNAAGLSAHQWGIQNDKLANSTGYLSKLPAGWTVMYDKLGSGGQGWGFIGQGHANSQFSLPSMQSYNVSANRFEKGDVSKYLRRAEIATRTLVNGVDTGDLTTVAGYALRIWDGNSSSTFFIHPMNGVVANNQTYGNFTNPTLGSTTSPVYVSNTGANRPFYLGWNNLNISIANVASAHVSIQLGRDALSKMNAIGIYASTFGGLGAMGITESGNGVFYNLPLAYRLITSE